MRVRLSPDGRHIVSAGFFTPLIDPERGEPTAHLWDVTTGEELATFSTGEAGITGMDFMRAGRQLVIVAQDGSSSVWDIYPGPQAIVDAVRQTATRCLTVEQRKRYNLAPEPPQWCSSQHLWPFN